MWQISFLGNTITSEGITPETKKIEKFLDKNKIPQTVKQVERLFGFTLFFSTFHTKVERKAATRLQIVAKGCRFQSSRRSYREF